jgi:hypothetical protein
VKAFPIGVHPAQQSAGSKEEGNVRSDQMTHQGALGEGGVDVRAHKAQEGVHQLVQ